MYIMSARKFTFSYGSPATGHFIDVTDVVYSRHIVNGRLKFSESEELDAYFGDPVPGLPKQLIIYNAGGDREKVAEFWQRQNIDIQV